MTAKSSNARKPAAQVVKDIRRATRRHFSAEDKIRIVLDGLRGEDSIGELCGKEGIAQSLYYTWSKDFMEAGKRRLADDTARAATRDEVKDLRRDPRLSTQFAGITGVAVATAFAERYVPVGVFETKACIAVNGIFGSSR